VSVTIGYFFNHPKNLAELAEDINGWLGCSLSPYEGNPNDLYDRFLCMEFSLFEVSGYENDRELDFENYRYELNFRRPTGDSDLEPILLPVMLMVVFGLHRRLGIEGMLAYDVQILLARYEERNVSGYKHPYLFDLVSNTLFTDFREHLDVVVQRLRSRR
jgi:hypothetical protein